MITPINYYGGKLNMLKYILPLIPNHRVYIEPFFGGGSVFYAKRKSQVEIINDLNDNVVNFWRVCQRPILFKQLKNKIKTSLHSRSIHHETSQIYKNPEGYSKVDKAWAFWYQTNVSFANKCGNGGWAYDFNTKDNSHQGRVFLTRIGRFSEHVFDRMQGVQIDRRNANTLLETVITDDAFVYIDPPYISSDMGHYKGMYNEKDFIKTLDILSNANFKFLLSSYKEDILLDYIEDNNWKIKEVEQCISVANKYGTRKRKIECLTYNYDIIENDQHEFNFLNEEVN